MDKCSSYSNLDDKYKYTLDKQDDVPYNNKVYTTERHNKQYCRELNDAIHLNLSNKKASWQRQTEQGVFSQCKSSFGETFMKKWL